MMSILYNVFVIDQKKLTTEILEPHLPAIVSYNQFNIKT